MEEFNQNNLIFKDNTEFILDSFHNGNVTGDFAYTAEHFHYSVSLDEKKHAFTTSNELSRVTYLLIIFFFNVKFYSLNTFIEYVKMFPEIF